MPSTVAPAPGPEAAGLAEPELAEMLRVIALHAGVDLGGQRPAMLARRAACQIAASGARSVADYLALLRSDVAEPRRLLERLTIKVSRLFRDPHTFATVGAQVVPGLRRARGAAPLRAWSAGCACGEEAYGLAILCAESGGPWTVLGTDVDRSALEHARAGAYALADAALVPAELAARHLARDGATIAARPELARHVRFEAHDLASGAPPPGGPFDLVACRNVLIYYLADRQERILASILRSLAPGGVLVLGEAEWPPPSVAGRLALLDRRCRIFQLADRGGGSV